MDDTTKNTEHTARPYKGIGAAEDDLKSIRESKGLTLRDIFERTRISTACLTAIENGDFHLLPAPVFTKSFIKIYAKTLEIDGNFILTRYEQYLETLKLAHRDVRIKEIPKSARMLYKIFLWGFLIIIIVGLVTFSLSTYETAMDVVKNQIPEKEHRSSSSKTTEDIAAAPKSEVPDQTNVAVKTQEGDAQQAPLEQPKPALRETEEKQIKRGTASEEINKNQGDMAETYQLVIEARELTWLRIAADQNSPTQILLQPGEKVQREGERFIIDIGNAGGIDVTFQGKSLGSLGEQGQVVHLKLP